MCKLTSSLESFQNGIDVIVGAVNTKAGTSLTKYDSPTDIANAISNISTKGWFTTGTVTSSGNSKTFTVSCADYQNYKEITIDNIKVGMTFEKTKSNYDERSATLSLSSYDASSGVATLLFTHSNNTKVTSTMNYVVCVIP